MLGNGEQLDCPENHSDQNVTKVFVNPSLPSTDGQGQWMEDKTLSFQCWSDDYQPVNCSCKKYQVSNAHYSKDGTAANLMNLTGEYQLTDGQSHGLLAPLYYNSVRNTYLYSHHPQGLVWQIWSSIGERSKLRGVFSVLHFDIKKEACPDEGRLKWEWEYFRGKNNQQNFVQDLDIYVKCAEDSN